MRFVATAAMAMLLCGGALAQNRCENDADCAPRGTGYRCITHKTGCPDNPSMSTCAERSCIQAPTPVSTLAKPSVKSHAIREGHRRCRADADCAVVVLGCHCMYCARPEDAANGVVDAVNKRFIKSYEALSKCSDSELKGCATAGPCAITGESAAVCRQERCEVVYKPRN